mmetsp:Transcript_20098/g.33188  ORF Transcript_20098/g.33188 Transcript_20098/m.33188 type:complete len:153 (+) Transcript_20098:214-672(+)
MEFGNCIRLLFIALACMALLPSCAHGEGPKETEEINKILKQTEFIKVLEKQSANQNKRLDELHHRVENELARINKHFEEMLEKIHESEQNIEKNLERIEKKVLGEVQSAKRQTSASHGSWKWPFFILFFALVGVAGFFGRLYHKATKHSHFL